MNIQLEATKAWRQMRREWREMDYDERSQLVARLAAHERAAASGVTSSLKKEPTRPLMSRPFVTMTAKEIAAEVERAIAVARARGVIR